MLTKEELLDRRNYIGASDVPAILGVSPYKTALDIYREKIGDTPIDTTPAELGSPIDRGNRCEATILRLYGRQVKRRLRTVKKTYTHPKYPYMKVRLDGLDAKPNEPTEIKTSLDRGAWGEPDTTQVPNYYWPQFAFQSSVTGAERIVIPVMFFPVMLKKRLEEQALLHRCKVSDLDYTLFAYEFAVYYYNKNKKQEKQIVKIVKNFWENHVLKRIPPSAQNLADMKYLYPYGMQESIVGNDEIIKDCATYRDLHSQEKLIKEKKEALQLKIKAYMGSKGVLLDNKANRLVTWNSHTTKHIDLDKLAEHHPRVTKKMYESIPVRPFLIKKEKKEKSYASK